MVKRDKNGRFIKGSTFWKGKKRNGLKGETQFKKGLSPWNKGMKMSKEHCEKLSKSQKLVAHPNARGDKNYRFKNGKFAGLRTVEFKKWREDVFIRDNYTCQDCGSKKETLHAHHIKSRHKYPELIYDVDNGLTLCKKCHRKTNSYGRQKKNNKLK